MGLSELAQNLLTVENGLIMLTSSALIKAVARVFPGQFKRGWVARIQPLLPILLCSLFVWLPGVRPDEAAGARFFVGIILGSFSASIYKAVTQTLLGRDKRIGGDKLGL